MFWLGCPSDGHSLPHLFAYVFFFSLPLFFALPLFGAPLSPPHPLAYFMPPWTPRKPSWPAGSEASPLLRTRDLSSHFPLFGTPLRKDICLAPWTAFKKRDYVRVGINVRNSYLGAVWAFGEWLVKITA